MPSYISAMRFTAFQPISCRHAPPTVRRGLTWLGVVRIISGNTDRIQPSQGWVFSFWTLTTGETVKNFLTTEDWTAAELDALLDLAAGLKREPLNDSLRGKSVALLFLNPSMRTRTSFQLGMQQLGGIAIVLQPGKDAWGVEFKPGVVMDGEAEEHIAEVAGVLSRYVDLIGMRAFPKFKDW